MSDYPGYYKHINCKSSKKRAKDYKFQPAKHQEIVTEYFLNSPYKGLLLYHKLGSGKSCTSIMVADAMLKNNKVEMVYVLTPGSLRKNWISEYCRVCGSIDNKKIMTQFVFITYNYNVNTNLKHYDFNNSLVIIDEAHNLLNGYKNQSINATALYEKIVNSNCKVLALSGTPIIQDDITMDWKNLSRLLDGGRSLGETIISDKNLKGIVSFFPGDPTKYPKVIIKPIQRVQMTQKQYEIYKEIYRFEEKIRIMGPPRRKDYIKKPIEFLKRQQEYIKANKYLLSRMISNCFYGTVDLVDESKSKQRKEEEIKDVEDVEDVSDNDTLKARNIKNKKSLPDKLVNENGWISNQSLADRTLLKISPKFSCILLNIIKNIYSKHVIYSFYKTRSGVQLLYTLLTHCGITAEIYSGDIDVKKREKILDTFNDESNRNGKKLKVLLITEAGAEGISVLECNNIHIVESSTKENRTRQAIGRVIRYKSHEKLPKDEQYVNVWRYWSVYGDARLVDEELYYKGLISEKMIDKFTERLIKNSIENI